MNPTGTNYIRISIFSPSLGYNTTCMTDEECLNKVQNISTLLYSVQRILNENS